MKLLPKKEKKRGRMVLKSLRSTVLDEDCRLCDSFFYCPKIPAFCIVFTYCKGLDSVLLKGI